MTTSSLTPLFSLALHHDYFADGICHGASVDPDVTTAHQLAALGCIWKRAATGGTLYAPASSMAAVLAAGLTPRFVITPHDQDFLTYTADSDMTLDVPLPTPLTGHADATTYVAPTIVHRLAAREVTWQYLVVADAAQADLLRTCFIDDTQAATPPVQFLPVDTPPAHAPTARVFRSDRALPLRERPAHTPHVVLRGAGHANRSVPLPVPTPQQTSLHGGTTTTPQWIAEVVVRI
ncbi:MAG: hypothetical protein LCH84_01260 [Gemmatimonadetes bacterium]|nr:hypothetical protein [Gemmatimonadota bacterium]